MVKKTIERKLVSQHVKDRLPSSFVFFWLQPLHDGNGPKHGPMALSHPHQPCLIFNEFNSGFFRLLFHARNSLQYHLARRQRQFVLRRPRRCLSRRLMMIQLYGFCCRVYHRVSLCLLTHNEYLRRSSPGYCEKKSELSIIIID